MAFTYNPDLGPTVTEQNRQNDIEAAILLANIVINMANGLADTSNRGDGRNRLGRFVPRPKAIEAQRELEAALLFVSKRIAARENHT